MPGTPERDFRRRLGMAASLGLFGVMVLFTARYALTLPYWDQWKFIPTLGRFFEGELRFQDLWAQHNAHRIVFPRLVMLGLAWLTRWNIGFEIAVNVVLAGVIFGVLVAYARRVPTTRSRVLGPWIAPGIGVFAFSLAQWQNLVWGWQMQIFMNIVAALGGLYVLTGSGGARWRVGLAAVLGVIATFSFANGLAYWAVGLIALVWMGAGVRWIAGWAAISAIVTGAYLWGFEIPSSHTGPGYTVRHLIAFAEYVFTFVGGAVVGVSNPLRVSTVAPLAVGIAGVATFGVMAVRAARERGVVVPLAVVGLYVLGSAMIAGVGRLEEGSAQALASRYATVAGPFWVAWMVLALHTAARVGRRRRDAIAVGVAAVVVAGVLNSARGAHAGMQRCQFVLEAREAVETGGDADLLQRVYPRVEEVRALREVLVRHRLGE